MTERSISFDRAAEYYDRTRTFGDEANRAETELLVSELRSRSRVLEVGVGTGQVAMRLHAAGISMFGVDVSSAMLRKLVAKAGGAAPIPVVAGDAARMPFRAGTFDGVVMRHVLHLIPLWREVVEELVRVVRQSGVVLVNHGGFSELGQKIRAKMEEFIGQRLHPVGLGWERWKDLETALAAHGATRRALPSIVDHGEKPLSHMVAELEANRFSWTWPLKEYERLSAIARLRPWLEERYGPLDAPFPYDTVITWHAYDLA
jgi:ubiquinone/menaquinone biosynthesis C-methylase UbiE